MTITVEKGDVNRIPDTGYQIHDSKTSFVDVPDMGAWGAIRRSQYIPDDHIAQLKRDKIDATHDRMGDFHRVCSIPVSVVEEWERQGFNIHDKNVTLHDIMKRLQKDHLDAFITTNKRVV